MQNNKEKVTNPPQSTNIIRLREKESTDSSVKDWRKEKNRLTIINEVGLAVTQMLDLNEIVQYTFDVLTSKLGVSECLIYLRDEENNHYSMCHSYGVDEVIEKEIEASRNEGIDFVQEIADSRQAMFIPKVDMDERISPEIRKKHVNHYYFGFPMISRSMVIGVIELISPSLSSYDLQIAYFLENIGREIGVAIDNALLVAKAKKQQEDAMTLYELGTKISSSMVMSEVLDAISESAKTLLHTDIGVIGMFQESCQEIKIWSASGEGGDRLEGFTFNVHESQYGKKLLDRDSIFGELEQKKVGPNNNNGGLDIEGYSSFMAIPLHLGDKFLGIIGVLSKIARDFSEKDTQLLKQLGYHVFVAIENARLHQQLRYGAALEEQNRLARELHDNLAQALGYLKIKAIMAHDMITKQDCEKAKSHLSELINTTSVLYTDIREAIFNLRNTDSDQGNFFGALSEYLEDYQRNYGLAVRFAMDDISSIEFSPDVANQLMRIVQEALSNVRKHSCAHHVWIRFWQEQGNVFLKIEDDGSGFDLSTVSNREDSKQRFGLQIMQERVQYINGKLTIESEPGKGTKVLIQLPSLYIR